MALWPSYESLRRPDVVADAVSAPAARTGPLGRLDAVIALPAVSHLQKGEKYFVGTATHIDAAFLAALDHSGLEKLRVSKARALLFRKSRPLRDRPAGLQHVGW